MNGKTDSNKDSSEKQRRNITLMFFFDPSRGPDVLNS